MCIRPVTATFFGVQDPKQIPVLRDLTRGVNKAFRACPVQYLEAWLGGLGCVPLYNLMEDAATAEICRTQVGVNLDEVHMHLSVQTPAY